MRTFLFLFLIISQLSLAQNVKFLDSIPLKADTFIGVDEFENYYYTIGNTLYKKSSQKTYSYTNTQLGNIASIDITNPLKVLVFYSGFNTIVLLDNHLNEFTNSINLTTESFAKNVAFARTASSNNIWLFSKDDNTLSLWDYKTDNTIFESQPLSFYQSNFEAKKLESNYKYCWILTEKKLIKFNEFGSYLETTILDVKSNVYPYKKGYLTIDNNQLYYIENTQKTKLKGFNPTHKTKNLFIKQQILYFFDSNMLYKYEVLKI